MSIKDFQRIKRQCPVCNYQFYPIRKNQVACDNRTCINKNRKLTARRKHYEKSGIKIEGNLIKCRICEKMFKTHRINAVLCSDECREINSKDSQRRLYQKKMATQHL